MHNKRENSLVKGVCVYLGAHLGGMPWVPVKVLVAKLVMVEGGLSALGPAEEFRKGIRFT